MSRFRYEKNMDLWIQRKIGLGEITLNRANLEDYQLEMIKETLAFAKENSRFYKDLLQGICPTEMKGLADLENVPFTTPLDLQERGGEMICVSPNEISRIVTLDTSGSTGSPKRVSYTEADQELTVDFFHHGMKNLVDEENVVLILLPYQRPGSVGDLLAEGLHRLGAKTVPFGLLSPDYAEAMDLLALMEKEGVTSIVGGPVQVLALARLSEQLTQLPDKKWIHTDIAKNMRSILLSTEYVSPDVCKALHGIWGCDVFEHYGMTEMGLGGAVSCWTLEGYHLREADLYVEIIDPETGKVAPHGEWGEVVFTTLTRKAMPFIRYRTGDVSRWIQEPCPCGSVLKRLDRVQDRKEKKNRS